MPAPPNALCVFAAGACGFAAQRLLALAHTRNVLQYRDPLARVWHVMTLDEHSADLTFTSAAYGWLPVLNPRRGEVVLIPADRGLCRLWINPVSETCRAEPVFDAAIASAPGAAGRHVACLFSSACGTRLWSALADGAQVALHDCAAAPAAGWMRPVSYDGRILWLHPFGQLIWQPGAPPQWRPWPRGFSARLELGGPTQSCDGRLWHIGHAGQQYAFIELGRDKPQMEPISGARAGVRHLACFFGAKFRLDGAVLYRSGLAVQGLGERTGDGGHAAGRADGAGLVQPEPARRAVAESAAVADVGRHFGVIARTGRQAGPGVAVHEQPQQPEQRPGNCAAQPRILCVDPPRWRDCQVLVTESHERCGSWRVSLALGQHGVDRARRQRATVQETLNLVARQLFQQHCLGCGFDPFGDDLQLERVGQ